MRLAIGSDHAGVDLKAELTAALRGDGHEIIDVGTHSDESVDYPIFCAAVGRIVATNTAELGIVLGGSGQGEQLAANKVAGVRAALCNDLYTARMARQHNDANVLSIGARVVAGALALEIVRLFIATPFEGGRHARRIEELSRLEALLGNPDAQDAYLSELWDAAPAASRGNQQTLFPLQGA